VSGADWWQAQQLLEEREQLDELSTRPRRIIGEVTMSIALRTPPSAESIFTPAPAGWHVARCFDVIDLGTHFDQKWDKETHFVRIGFELPKTKRDDGKPFAIYKRYTLSHHEKARLRQDLEAWYGKKFSTGALNKAGGFDLGKLIDRTAFVNVTHDEAENGTVFANIAALGPLPADMDCPPMMNPPRVFSLQEFDQAVFDSLTDKTKEQIKESGEWKVMTGEIKAPPSYSGPVAGGFNTMDSDIPF
jgi:hypothetical protein